MKGAVATLKSAGDDDESVRAASTSTSTVKLGELLRLIPLQSVHGETDIPVSGVAIDSREIRPGFLFVAVEGETTDGHRYLAAAAASGAIGVVSERSRDESWEGAWIQTPDARKAAGVVAARVYGEPAEALELVGVTGTNGKTTFAYLLDRVFRELRPPSAMMGTIVRRIGERSWTQRHTTPEAPAVQSFLAEAVAAGCRHGVLEVSSHGLRLSRMEGTRFALGLFTNLSRDHLDFHRDMEDYFRAKRQLFERHLKPDGRAVVCVDDPYGERLAAELTCELTTYGASPTADLCLRHVDAGPEGLNVRFTESGAERELRSPLLGSFNAANLVAVYGASRALGLAAEDVLGVLSRARGAPGRFEPIPVARGYRVVVDYAHTDVALRNVLTAARPLTDNKLWVVFGAGGDRDREKRSLMGSVAARLADRVVLTSDNPRGEDPVAILRDIEQGVGDKEVILEPDRREAIRLVLGKADAGDWIVIAGKGHEPYQIIGDRVIDFDDREIVRELAGEVERSGQEET